MADWSDNSWVDFAWADDACPESYEAIGNRWLGTNPGNYTETDVIWASEDTKYTTNVTAVELVFQTKCFADMPSTVLCGKRGDLSYLIGVRVESEA